MVWDVPHTEAPKVHACSTMTPGRGPERVPHKCGRWLQRTSYVPEGGAPLPQLHPVPRGAEPAVLQCPAKGRPPPPSPPGYPGGCSSLPCPHSPLSEVSGASRCPWLAKAADRMSLLPAWGPHWASQGPVLCRGALWTEGERGRKKEYIPLLFDILK